MVETKFMSKASAKLIDEAIAERTAFQVETCTQFDEDGDPFVVTKVFECIDIEDSKWEVFRYNSDDTEMAGVSEGIIDEADINDALNYFYEEIESNKASTLDNLAAVGYVPVYLCKVVKYCGDFFAVPNHETLEVEIEPHDPTDEAVKSAFSK